MALRKGGEGAAEAAKSFGNYTRTRFFGLDDGKQMIVRFLTDSPEWVYVDQHNSVPTKNKPNGFDGNWPQAMSATCRYDEGIQEDLNYADCYVCDNDIKDQWGNKNKPTVRVWALACVREQVVEEGKIVGYRDSLVEVPVKDKDGKPTEQTEKVRNIIVVNMGMKNFFTGLQGIYGIYGTVCDRDYVIKRAGTGKDSNYTIMPLDKIEGATPDNAEWWGRYTKAIEDQGYDLEAMVKERASDDYFAKFFDPNKTASFGSDGNSNGQAASGDAPIEPQSTGDVNPDEVQAMRDRVRGLAGGGQAPPAQQEQPVAAGAAAGPRNFD